MGSGSIKDGAKHVAVMLGVAYAVFLSVPYVVEFFGL
jgi:hypothetical protein